MLVPVHERVRGLEHPDTLTVRAILARWTGEAGMQPGPGTSTRRCCRYGSESLALSILTP